MSDDLQYLRKASLLLVEGEKALDLSEFHFSFKTEQDDQQSPANCAIRVYNLSDDVVRTIRSEYSAVVLQAGYQSTPFGVIFSGSIRQYGIGRMPDGVNSYLDILAADGDIDYNYGVVNKTLAAGSTPEQQLVEVVKAMGVPGNNPSAYIAPDALSATGGILPRGKVLFGAPRAALRSITQNAGATWSIQNGQVQVIALTGYKPGEAVVLTAQNGLIGRVEQTINGMTARCLLNPKITPGNLVKIDNASINQVVQQNANIAALSFNKRFDFKSEQRANVAADGVYRVIVAEHVGDTRGNDWYTDIVGLSLDPVTKKVKAYG